MANAVKSNNQKNGVKEMKKEVKAPAATAKTYVENPTIVKCEGVKIKNLTSASTIMRIAQEKGLNPQEVFVRCTFEYNGNDFTASNKLRILTRAGYQELLDAKDKGTVLTFSVDIDNGFFYIEHEVSLDELFATPVESTVADTRKKLTDLLA